jgi:hypothetical protein
VAFRRLAGAAGGRSFARRDDSRSVGDEPFEIEDQVPVPLKAARVDRGDRPAGILDIGRGGSPSQQDAVDLVLRACPFVARQ